MCRAYEAGRISLREGMCFYVTAARMKELSGWLAGGWVVSRIVERHTTFTQAGDAVRGYNRDGQSGQKQGCFYFVSSNKALT